MSKRALLSLWVCLRYHRALLCVKRALLSVKRGLLSLWVCLRHVQKALSLSKEPDCESKEPYCVSKEPLYVSQTWRIWGTRYPANIVSVTTLCQKKCARKKDLQCVDRAQFCVERAQFCVERALFCVKRAVSRCQKRRVVVWCVKRTVWCVRDLENLRNAVVGEHCQFVYVVHLPKPAPFQTAPNISCRRVYNTCIFNKHMFECVCVCVCVCVCTCRSIVAKRRRVYNICTYNLCTYNLCTYNTQDMCMWVCVYVSVCVCMYLYTS